MRLDKYLKVSRIIKRRTVANEVCDAKHVTVNGKIARASYLMIGCNQELRSMHCVWLLGFQIYFIL